ncbi:FxSxx-COOH system tetratricopeptide repeat protein [Streptomyces sp. VRA16 Mangrove soil]|uniref:FxSxx-COOH system tetratricopeptide repeat protein n=1 Tax=Streptomyces sp. VRA16 Mangrove soil TaxID=2817434 RepID=UPI001A9E2CB6|nr:FxSxx-COOH system tetratricopeptide repeat protein [Streptomyces sp. VRA16 Mangrove soil]MBO1332582.1 ATP-binding protein [Streptomyces sp. VRA16 Mangrove soil]
MVTLPAEAVAWARDAQAPPGAGNLPGSASGVFVGREEELAALRRELKEAGEAAVTQAARVVHGLGGIGKSTLALHYAHTYRHDYTLVWWIGAESAEQILAGLAALAVRLCPQWAAGAGVGTEERAAWAMLWLQWHPGWLLIHDNVEDPRDLRHCLGSLPDGHHLATSRTATGWHSIAPTVALGLLSPQASADLLSTLAFGRGRVLTGPERAEAEQLAAFLGHLPLALEQAGAYLYETGACMPDYLDMLERVMDSAPGGIDPQRTIARIWHHTLDAVRARNPSAIRILDAMAWLAPDEVPRVLLAPLADDALALGEALGVLHAYNMVSFSEDRRSVSVHRLVQTVLRERPGWPGRRDAERLVWSALSGDSDAFGGWGRIVPDVVALAVSTPSGYVATDDAVRAWRVVARYLSRLGRNAHTVLLRAATLAQYEETLGDTHPRTLTARVVLADALLDSGDGLSAVELYETVAEYRVRELGYTHPDTLNTLSGFARVCLSVGLVDGALRLYEDVLARMRLQLGEEHRDTMNTRHNLASAYAEAGDFRKAISLGETIVEQSARLLGDSDPATLRSRNNLALAYESAGEHERAVRLHEATLAQREHVLGPTHPGVMTSRHNLALAYKDAGDLERALPLLERNLAQRRQVLGETHPQTLTSYNWLALAYKDTGDLDRAVPLLERNLERREQVLGHMHPHTMNSRAELAHAYAARGDDDRAIFLFELALAQLEDIMGDSHPDTMATRGHLAAVCRKTGDLDRAVRLYETTLVQRERVLGESHRKTMHTRNSLAVTCRQAGDPQRAVHLHEVNLAHRERTLGADHPSTVLSRDNLAVARRAAAAAKAGQQTPPGAGRSSAPPS